MQRPYGLSGTFATEVPSLKISNTSCRIRASESDARTPTGNRTAMLNQISKRAGAICGERCRQLVECLT